MRTYRLSLSFLMLAACGGTTAPSGGGGPDASSGWSAGSGSSGASGSTGNSGSNEGSGAASGSMDAAASGGGSGSSGGGCPSVPPAEGAACMPPWDAGSNFPFPPFHCSWGDDPRGECRTKASCGSAWHVTGPAPSCSTPALPPGCPSAAPSGGTACSNTSLACFYDDGSSCRCSGCAPGCSNCMCKVLNPAQWICDQPPANCPPKLPQAGAPCNVPGASCSRDCNLNVVCSGGVWQWTQGYCPICAAPDTPIATPNGDRPIASLRVGDLVYSVDRDAIVAVPLARVGRTPVSSHHVIRVVLSGGAVLLISPGHPTADGRTFGELTAGAALDPQHTVLTADLVPYTFDATYDVLPDSSTGTYFAAGALIGSTLFDARVAIANGHASAR